MPRYSPATRILRDDLLAQLRSAGRPLSTTELRDNAPRVPMPRIGYPVAPISEQIYRIVCALHRDGLVTRGGASGRTVTWTATPTGADAEIAALEAAFARGADTHHPLTTVEHAANHLIAAAARDQTDATLGHLLAQWADISTNLPSRQHLRHPRGPRQIAAPTRARSRTSTNHHHTRQVTMSATISVPASGRWLTRLCSGQPHQIIAAGDTTYLRRWFLWPKSRWLNCYLHHFVSSDDPTALHDHPWWFLSICLAGRYLEISQDTTRLRRPGTVALRRPDHRHRIQLLTNSDGTERRCWTVVVTGPRVRPWGFWCPSANGDTDRFLPWQQFGHGGC